MSGTINSKKEESLRMDTAGALTEDIELKKSSFQTCLITWGLRHFRRFPWREERTPYSVLISEILLRRTTSSAVKRIYQEFLSEYPNIQKLAKSNSKALEKLLAKIGFHKQRTKMLIEVANFIISMYGGNIPNSKEELLSVPHVGDYTANAVLTFAYDIPTAPVDSNVKRIMKRVFLKHVGKKTSSKEIQYIADLLSTAENNQEYNYALLDLGATVCLYSVPKCRVCPVSALCDYYRCGNPHK